MVALGARPIDERCLGYEFIALQLTSNSSTSIIQHSHQHHPKSTTHNARSLGSLHPHGSRRSHVRRHRNWLQGSQAHDKRWKGEPAICALVATSADLSSLARSPTVTVSTTGRT